MARRGKWAEWPWQFVAMGRGSSRRVADLCAQADLWFLRLAGEQRPDGRLGPPHLHGPYRSEAAARQTALEWAGGEDPPLPGE